MNVLICAAKAVLNLIFAVFKLFPVRDKVTLISRQSDAVTLDFALLDAAVKEESPGTGTVILCRTMGRGIGGKIAYCFHMLRQMYHIATSRRVVLDSYCIAVSNLRMRPETVVFQIWHAIGLMKKFGLSIAGNGGEGRDIKLADALNMHRNYDRIMVNSEIAVPAFSEAFGYPADRFFIGSLPRVDLITSERYREEKAKEILARYPEIRRAKEEGRQVAVYAPTFRVGRDISGYIEELSRALERDGTLLIVKKHPIMEVPDVKGSMIVDTDFSTMEMLCAADVVICDYSAVVFEAALMGKKLLFYAFDLDEYKGRRDFYIDYAAEVPGEICRTGEEAAAVIADDRFDPARVRGFAEKYVTVRHDASKLLAERILEG